MRPTSVTTSRILLALALAAALFTADLSASPKSGSRRRSHGSNTRKTAEFQALPLLRSRQNHLLVRAFINGKAAWLEVDSGSPMTAVVAHRRKYFGLTDLPKTSALPPRLQINGAFNDVVIARHLRIGNLNLLDEPVVTLDMGSSPPNGRPLDPQQIDGILGADILFPTKAVLECKRQLLILKLDPDLPGKAPGIDYRGYKAIPMHVSDGYNLYVNATINDAPARLMVDTGTGATLLHKTFVREMRIPTQETRLRSAAVNLQQRGVRVARIRKLSVGAVDIIGRQVGVIDLEGLIQNEVANDVPPVVGLLGAEMLSRHHGIIDFGTHTLYLRR